VVLGHPLLFLVLQLLILLGVLVEMELIILEVVVVEI
jgi:hypothetical protein